MSEQHPYAWVKTYRTDPAERQVFLTVFDPDTGLDREVKVTRSELEMFMLNLDADIDRRK